MLIKGVVYEDFINYKVPSMFIIFPNCTFKCEKECGVSCCQNSSLANSPNIKISKHKLLKQYLSNPITQAIVCGGLEPMDSFNELYGFIYTLRHVYNCENDIVIYTGYTEEECSQNRWLEKFASFKNIVIKFGRFIPNQQSHYDEVLGVNLASDNQYAVRIS